MPRAPLDLAVGCGSEKGDAWTPLASVGAERRTGAASRRPCHGGQFLAVVPKHDLVVAMTVEYDARDPAAEDKLITADTDLNLLEESVAPHFGA